MSRHVSNDLKGRARTLAAAENIPYSAALARLRTPRAEAATPADTPTGKTFLLQLPEYLYVDFPAPDLRGARPCDSCQGSSIDAQGRTFASPSDSDRPPLLIELVCSACEGCGRAEHDLENGCGRPHTDPDMDDGLYDEDNYDEEPSCFSCCGREFNYTQGFTNDDQGEPAEVVYLRVPCGCTAERARVILGDLVKVNG